MPVYLFTFHAYRSWMPDHPRGFVQKGKGYQPSNQKLNSAYRSAAKHDPVEFDPDTQRALIELSLDVCKRREWRLHAVATQRTHLHDLVSWRGDERWEDVRGKIKNILSLGLSKRAGVVGRPWFVDGASRKRVKHDDHLRFLIETYLPDHPGWGWSEEKGWLAPRGEPSPFGGG